MHVNNTVIHNTYVNTTVVHETTIVNENHVAYARTQRHPARCLPRRGSLRESITWRPPRSSHNMHRPQERQKFLCEEQRRHPKHW